MKQIDSTQPTTKFNSGHLCMVGYLSVDVHPGNC